MISRIVKPLTVLATVSMVTFSSYAQKFGSIKFEKQVHEFGSFKEEAGPQKYRFQFSNVGLGVIKIDRVQAGCGCTTPDWSKEEVPAGKTGFVEAEYNPAGRPGKFDKGLTVFVKMIDATDKTKTKDTTLALTIRGSVIEREKTAADLYPDKMGPYRLLSRSLYMDKLTPGSTQIISKTFKIYNDSEEAYTMSQINTSALPHVKITIDPLTIKPKETATIKVDFNPANKKDYGFSNDVVKLESKSASGTPSSIELYVAATLEDTPKKLTDAEKAKAPKLVFDKKEHDFGTINDHQEVSHSFTFTNKGASKLTIKKTKANCGCTASEPAKKELMPGESSSIKVTFNSTGKHEGANQQMVTIYSSDPEEPTQYVTIKANVDKKAPDRPALLSAPNNMMKVGGPKK